MPTRTGAVGPRLAVMLAGGLVVIHTHMMRNDNLQLALQIRTASMICARAIFFPAPCEDSIPRLFS